MGCVSELYSFHLGRLFVLVMYTVRCAFAVAVIMSIFGFRILMNKRFRTRIETIFSHLNVRKCNRFNQEYLILILAYFRYVNKLNDSNTYNFHAEEIQLNHSCFHCLPVDF